MTGTRTAVRVGRTSFRLRPRAVVVCAGMGLGVLLLVCVNVGVGEVSKSPVEVARVLLGGGDRVDRLIVVDLRLPRTLVAIAVGAALGISGAVVQSITRNALASPDILGVTTGASVGAVLVIVLGAGAPTWILLLGVPGAALLGGLASGLLIFVLAWRRGLDGYRVVLIGIGINAAMASMVSLLLVQARIDTAVRANVWLTGSLEGRGWPQLWPVLLVLLVAGTACLTAGHAMATLRLDDDTAVGLGARVGRTRVLLLVGAVLLASAAASAAGPVAFVAFVAPQVARRVLRTPGEPVVGGALVGAALMLGADVVARVLLPVALPVGIVTAVIGAPYFLHLLLRRHGRTT